MTDLDESVAFFAEILHLANPNAVHGPDPEAAPLGAPCTDDHWMAQMALHESAHAVVAERLGSRVRSIMMREDGDGGACNFEIFDTFASRIARVVIALVGRVAEQRACAASISQKATREGYDFTSARRCLNELVRDFPACGFDCETAARLAVSIVEARWGDILNLAAELYAQRSMSGEQVRMILDLAQEA